MVTQAEQEIRVRPILVGERPPQGDWSIAFQSARVAHYTSLVPPKDFLQVVLCRRCVRLPLSVPPSSLLKADLRENLLDGEKSFSLFGLLRSATRLSIPFNMVV